MHTEKGTIETKKYRTPKMFNTQQFKDAQKSFEKNLGVYSYNHPRSYNAVNLANRNMEARLFPYYKQKVNKNATRLQFLQDTFVHDESPQSSGQIGGDMSRYIEFVVNSNMPLDDNNGVHPYEVPGNLREKMTAFYNACLFNADKVHGDRCKSIVNYKMYMSERFTYLYNQIKDYYEGLPEGSPMKEKLKNHYETLKSASENDFFSSTFLFGINKDKTMDFQRDYCITKRRFVVPPSHRLGFQNDLGKGLEPSSREIYYQYNKSICNEYSRICNGGDIIVIDEPSSENNVQQMLDNGFTLTGGISCTAARLLMSCMWMGMSNEQLLDFRMALIGWMIPNNDHSLYEILKGARIVGILGRENMDNADTMDRTVSPLDEEILRDKVCDEYEGQKLFPLEIAIIKLSEENKLPDTQNEDDIENID